MLFILCVKMPNQTSKIATYEAANMSDAIDKASKSITLSVFHTYELLCVNTGEQKAFSKRSIL